tara:strand:- start:2232 stop:2795 length:564 start_codon:yes stop_codon:yes gene_type:complete
MNEDIKSYVKLSKKGIDDVVCNQTIESLKTWDWEKHSFYNPTKKKNNTYDTDLDVSWGMPTTYNTLQDIVWSHVKSYIVGLEMPWFESWQGFNQLRFNKYNKNQEMRYHCDHITDMFDGNKRGVPILSVLGFLNEDYKGGDFLMFNNDNKIDINKGDILIFPSNFLYPHKVKPIIEGTRYTFITWVY